MDAQIVEIGNKQREVLKARVSIAHDTAPAVILHHGYAGSMESPVIVRLEKTFRAAGFSTIVPDTTNSLNSSGGNVAAFTFSKHASDLKSVSDWTKDQPWFSGALHLAGYSLGGYSAATLAGKDVSVRSALLVAPIFSGAFFKEAFEKANPGIMAHWQRQKSLPFTTDRGLDFAAPFAAWEEWLKADAAPAAANFRGDVHIVTAANDTLILPSHGGAMRAAFDRARTSVAVLPGEDHAFAQGSGLEIQASRHAGRMLAL